MISVASWRWLAVGVLVWGVAGCLPLDQELEVLFAPEAVGNALFFRDSIVFSVLQGLLF